ncbi:NlpC/P60 family protein [Arcobacter sp. YIC-464]|uniref:NlpC/P60 family protein n=1 Tax=Arcobacter sp. YIC-464 TaxID=3376631 RepID=UPI003C29E9F1
MIKSIAFIFISLIFITGCSNKNSYDKFVSSYKELDSLPFPSASLENTLLQTNTQLKEFYQQWRGVRYKWGGNSKRGIDCSAFVQKAYKNSFNLKLPRTTKSQHKVGKYIEKTSLRLGDLVFFKTGWDSRHVGIYLDNGRFMHASTKKGVIISSLNNSYYKKHYWKAKRVLF